MRQGIAQDVQHPVVLLECGEAGGKNRTEGLQGVQTGDLIVGGPPDADQGRQGVVFGTVTRGFTAPRSTVSRRAVGGYAYRRSVVVEQGAPFDVFEPHSRMGGFACARFAEEHDGLTAVAYRGGMDEQDALSDGGHRQREDEQVVKDVSGRSDALHGEVCRICGGIVGTVGTERTGYREGLAARLVRDGKETAVRIYPEPSCIFSQSIIECLERLPGRYRDGTVDVCDEEYLFGRYGIRRHERPVILLHAVQHGFLFGCFDAECLSGYRYVYHRHMFSIRYCRPRPRPRICPGRAFGVRCR